MLLVFSLFSVFNEILDYTHTHKDSKECNLTSSMQVKCAINIFKNLYLLHLFNILIFLIFDFFIIIIIIIIILFYSF